MQPIPEEEPRPHHPTAGQLVPASKLTGLNIHNPPANNFRGRTKAILSYCRNHDTSIFPVSAVSDTTTPRNILSGASRALAGNCKDGLAICVVRVKASEPTGAIVYLPEAASPRNYLYDPDTDHVVERNPQRAPKRVPSPIKVRLNGDLSEADGPTSFWFGAKCFIDADTNHVPDYCGPKSPLSPSRTATDLSVQKLKTDNHGDAFLMHENYPIGYASLWCVKDPDALLKGTDRDGNPKPEAVALAPEPGFYCGYLSSMRIIKRHRRHYHRLLDAVEKMLIGYAEDGIYFNQLVLRPHHRSIRDRLRELRADSSVSTTAAEADLLAVSLRPWQGKEGVLPQLKAAYQSKGLI